VSIVRWSHRFFEAEGEFGHGFFDDPENVHIARTSIRRMRAVLETCRPFVKGSSTSDVDRELRWFGKKLGAVRDDDVLAWHLRELGAKCVPNARPVRLLSNLDRQRQADIAALIDSMNSKRYAKLKRTFARPCLGIEFTKSKTESTIDAVLRQVAVEFSVLETMIRRSRHPGAKRLHKIRIQAKRCRYSAELASGIYGDHVTELADRLAALQDALGMHHDYVVLSKWMKSAVESANTDEASAMLADEARPILAAAAAELRTIDTSWKQVWKSCTRPELLSNMKQAKAS
jgi:CHAD domain-containing protein